MLKAILHWRLRGHHPFKWMCAGSFVLVAFIFLLVPTPQFNTPLSTVLYDQSGELLSATVAKDEQWRFPATTNLSDKFVHAITTFEDKRFYSHPGIDVLALGRAISDNLKEGRVVSGASTLTMQVARLARPGSARTLFSKAVEAVAALKLEIFYTKDEILNLYASHAPFGGNVVGIEAAAWRYFGRKAENLSWAEAATLAVLPNSPALIHPGRNRKHLQEKRDRLLVNLHVPGIINGETLTLAQAEPLPTKPHRIPNHAPHLLNHHVRQTGESQGHTTLVRSQQQMLTEVIERHYEKLSGNGIHNAAAIILKVDTGEVVAYVGNVPKFSPALHQNHVDIIQAPRSTGSVLKPLLYTAMMRDGALMPSQLVPDVPTRFGGFAPMNFGKSYDGAVPASAALARSLNIPASRMLRDYGLDRFYAELESMGMSTLTRPAEHYGLTLILGGSEATLWELTGMYAGLARAAQIGREQELSTSYFKPRYLANSQVENKDDETPAYRADPGAIYQTFTALLDVNRPGLGQGWKQFASSQPIAWKTGTSFGFRDAWSIGVTPKYAVGIWVGNADGEGRAGLTGTTAAAPIMLDVFSRLNRGHWFTPQASRMATARVCSQSGHLAGPHCEHTEEKLIPKGSLDTAPCGYCQNTHLHPTENHRVSSACAAVHTMRHTSYFVLPTKMETFYRRKHPGYKPLPSFHPSCPEATDSQEPSMAIVYPTPRSRIFVPRGLDGKPGQAVMEATHREPNSQIFWHLNDEFVGTTQGFHQIALAPPAGEHVLTLVDEMGARQRLGFVVME